MHGEKTIVLLHECNYLQIRDQPVSPYLGHSAGSTTLPGVTPSLLTSSFIRNEDTAMLNNVRKQKAIAAHKGQTL